MPMIKPQTCTARPNCRIAPICSFQWAGRTMYACSGHLQTAEATAKALGRAIDPEPYPPVRKPAAEGETEKPPEVIVRGERLAPPQRKD